MPIVLLAACLAFGMQPEPQQSAEPKVKAEVEPEDRWEFAASVYAYRIREDRDYLQPTITADHGAWHLEARYNYEDRDTGSAWIGRNLSFGEDLMLELTPMLGGVFGQSSGIAPGLKASLSWGKFGLYTELEYLLNFHDHHDNFLYTWSEATITPLERLSVGLVVQRTRVYTTDVDVERGLLLRLHLDPVEITGCIFSPFDEPTYVLGLGLSF